jgi:hypothetical protein
MFRGDLIHAGPPANEYSARGHAYVLNANLQDSGVAEHVTNNITELVEYGPLEDVKYVDGQPIANQPASRHLINLRKKFPYASATRRVTRAAMSLRRSRFTWQDDSRKVNLTIRFAMLPFIGRLFKPLPESERNPDAVERKSVPSISQKGTFLRPNRNPLSLPVASLGIHLDSSNLNHPLRCAVLKSWNHEAIMILPTKKQGGATVLHDLKNYGFPPGTHPVLLVDTGSAAAGVNVAGNGHQGTTVLGKFNSVMEFQGQGMTSTESMFWNGGINSAAINISKLYLVVPGKNGSRSSIGTMTKSDKPQQYLLNGYGSLYTHKKQSAEDVTREQVLETCTCW